MRLFIKLMILVLVLALAGPFFIKSPDGEPLLTTTDVKRKISQQYRSAKTSLQRMAKKTARTLGDDEAGKTTLYKWQDKDGQWHYTSEPPSDHSSQTIYIDPDANVIESSGVTTETTSARAEREAATGTGAEVEPLPAILPTPGRMQRAIDKTKESRDQLEERNQKLQEALIDP